MSKFKRPKYIPYNDSVIENITNQQGVPFKLHPDGYFSFLQNIPSGVVCGVYVSGNSSNSIQSNSASTVAGINVYRYAPDGPSAYDMDHYVVISGENPNNYTTYGPMIVDKQHWINEIPYPNADVIGRESEGDE